MSRCLILCEHAQAADVGLTAQHEITLRINQSSPRRNLRIEVTNITYRILGNLGERGWDLLDIASYVYAADRHVLRGGTSVDVFGERWRRRLIFVIPVTEIQFWSRQRDNLAELLGHLTGDEFEFHFVRRERKGVQDIFRFAPDAKPFRGADTVVLFSGGMDSLAGAVHAVRDEGRRPLLISHRSTAPIDRRQRHLASLLGSKATLGWQFPLISVWIHLEGEEGREPTQRSRSFLYLTLAAVTAKQLGISEIRICENGIVSVNLPALSQTVGTYASRTTHPRFVREYGEFVEAALGARILIENPFIYKTKADLVELLAGTALSDLIPATVSCAHPVMATRMQPHCGLCSQCVGRRLALVAVGAEDLDPPRGHRTDIFAQAIPEGRSRAAVESQVRMALDVSEMNELGFFTTYAELYDAVPHLPGGSSEGAAQLFDLFQRHSGQVIRAVQLKLAQHATDLMRGRLPETSLLALVGAGKLAEPPMKAYARRLGTLLSRALRTHFRGVAAKGEAEVQRAGETALTAAEERLRREYPTLAYGIVGTRPDFSNKESTLFLEFKHVKGRRDLNRVNTEITSRILIYRRQGASVLFVAFDNKRIISDISEVTATYEENEGVYVEVV